MNIGILTYHFAYNFGANIQVLSTVEYLKSIGHSPIVINWIPEDLENRYVKNTPKIQAQVHEEYIKTFLPLSELCKSEEDICLVIERLKIDGIIVGSDAVLRHIPFFARIYFPTRKIFSIIKPTSDSVYPNPFWGSFHSGLKHSIPMVLMSGSSQNTAYRKILGPERGRISNSLSLFNYFSVRDAWTRRMIRYITRNRFNPEITPDPVFAFNQNAGHLLLSKEEIVKKYNLPEKFLVMSFFSVNSVSANWVYKFKVLINDQGYKLVGLPMPNGMNDLGYDIIISQPLPPLDWVALIKYSSGYIGHNMHPIIVSIHNCVPFFSFDYYGILFLKLFVNKRSSKIFDILSRINGLDYYQNVLGSFKKKVTPNEVFEKIMGFNTSLYREISDAKYEEYIVMMNKIESALSR